MTPATNVPTRCDLKPSILRDTAAPLLPQHLLATSGDVWTTSQDNGFMVVKLDSNATASVGGGCASADASLGALLVFGLVELLRRRSRRA